MRFEFGFGIGFDKSGKAIDATAAQEAIKLILVEASLKFGGCNLLAGQGAWVNSAGDLVVEESRTLVVNTLASNGGRLAEDEGAKAAELAEFIRRVLNQEAVYLTKVVAVASLVEAKAINQEA